MVKKMGKPDFKSPRHRNPLTMTRPLTRSRTALPRNSANIKVVVRVRPPIEREDQDNYKNAVEIVDEQLLIFDPKTNSQAFFYHGVEQKGRDLLRKANKNMQFIFDRVFGYDSTNEELFESTTKSLIQSLMDGCNCSVFAYGATGAGKTHTMIGLRGNPGITYLTMAELFKVQGQLSEERNFDLGISYIEVYNELVQDLLNPGAPLQLRDDGKYGTMVAGIKIHKIQNPEDLFTLLAQGNSNRTQHPTDANAESSRSHAVFQVYIQMQFKAGKELRAAKLSMIDLAGSERGSATGFGGARFTEGANINKSLLALGNCINNLADGQKYVPYRDSKLTRLLKDSLGGNCQTVMIANVSPSTVCYEETYNTLKYATRAKKIKANVKRNIVNVEMHAGEYVKIVEDLKRELEKVKGQLREKVSQQKFDPEVSVKLLQLMESKKKLLDRMHNIEMSGSTIALKRQLKKQECKISLLFKDTPERQDVHRKLEEACERSHKQEDALGAELDDIKVSKANLEDQTREILERNPGLREIYYRENGGYLEAEKFYQVDLIQKKCSAFEQELKSRAVLLEKTCKMLQTCYQQLRGHGLAPKSLCQEYQSVVNQIRRNLTWETSEVDSGLSSPTSSTSTISDGFPAKRRLEEGPLGIVDLDRTFVMPSKAPKVQVCAEQLMTKVYTAYKKPSAKKAVKTTPLKENKNNTPNKLSASSVHKNKVVTKMDLTKRRPFRT